MTLKQEITRTENIFRITRKDPDLKQMYEKKLGDLYLQLMAEEVINKNINSFINSK